MVELFLDPFQFSTASIIAGFSCMALTTKMSSGKHILFYSNYCQYSKQVLTVIAKKNIRSLFLLVCVDGNKFNIPAFVNRVPMIFTAQQKLYADDGVMMFLDDLENMIARSIGAGGSGGDAYNQKSVQHEVSAYYAPDMDGAISDSFSYIDDSCTGNQQHQFVFIGNDPRIETPKETMSTVNSSTDKNPMDMMLEQMIAARNSDTSIRIANPHTTM